MKEKILKLGFEERDTNCYAISGDIGDLDLQISYDGNNPDIQGGIGIIIMGGMTEQVKDLKHLKQIVNAWNKLWTTICYT